MKSVGWNPELDSRLKGRKCLVATDVPFWKQANGSHARILELLRALHHVGVSIRVWYIGDSRSARQDAPHRLPFIQWRWCERLTDRWVHWLPRKPASGQKPRHHARVTSRHSTTDPIASFVDPAIARRFLAEIRRYQPDLFLCEYLSLATLRDAIVSSTSNLSQQPLTLIDTHDVLSQRHAESTRTGLISWLPVSAETELRWASKFDVVMAIREADAQFFRQARPSEQVVVVGHPATSLPLPAAPSEGCRFGILAGAGEPNLRGVLWLLESVWPAVTSGMPDATLKIAGSLGARLGAEASYGCSFHERVRTLLMDAQRVELQGHVEKPESFYQSIDVGLNPVDVDSGLKIKCIETIGFGRPLVTHPSGSIGSEVPVSVQRLASTPEAFIDAMLSFREKQIRQSAATQAALYATEHLTPRTVYGPLLQSLSSHLS